MNTKRNHMANRWCGLFFWGLSLLVAIGSSGCDSGSGGGGDDGGSSGAGNYTVSGSIEVSAGCDIDSDINDPLADYASNDSPEQAQSLSNPATVGGYVNVAGAGANGRSFSSGDRSDYYAVTLTAGQVVTLYIAESRQADLDLFLYDATGQTLIDASLGTGQYESLTISDAGGYIIEVYAFMSASIYNLVIGQSVSTASAQDLRLHDEFIPGQVIVRFSEGGESEDAATDSGNPAGTLAMRLEAGTSTREMLLSFHDPDTKNEVFQRLGVTEPTSTHSGLRSCDADTRDKLDTLWIIKSLRRNKDILCSDPNYIRHLLETPNDTYYGLQWHYPLINVPQAWDVVTAGADVLVAVIDTGVLLEHPDLQGQLVSGYDFISSTSISVDGDGIDTDPDDPGDQSPGGSSFHGTHVAGTVAASTNNGVGVAGIARSAKIMPLRALGKGGGTSYDILQAVRYAAGLENDSGTTPAQIADVMNLSFGGSGGSQSEQEVYSMAREAGIVIVAAAGNESSSSPSYPAAYDGVVSVSAVDMNGDIASYSNFGDTIDLAGPGGDTSSDTNGDGYPDGVLSTAGDDSSGTIQFVYKFYQGTSMAAPHAAGVAALMKAVYPGLSPDTFDSLIASGTITKDLGNTGRDEQYGFGLIDAYKAAVAAGGLAGGDLTIPATLVVNPMSLNFGTSSNSKTLTVENGGGESLVVTGVSDDADWLTVSATSVDAGGLGTYTATVDRGAIASGTYSATILFTSSANSVELPVILSAGDATHTGDAGLHYVLLLDSETLETVNQVDVSASQGVYSYSIGQVATGEYKIFCGSDLDNDFIVGDAGEASGAYPSLGQFQSFTVERNVSEIDFGTGFNVSIPTLTDFEPEPMLRLDRKKETGK